MTAATTPTMAATADHGTGRRATIRQRRVAKIIEDQLTVLIGNERHHPKLPFGALPQVTMLAVEVSPDLREATVWWEPDEFSSRSTHDLEPRVLKAANATRAALAKRISLRVSILLVAYCPFLLDLIASSQPCHSTFQY
jgi:ribosome-binding factor A